MTIHAAKGLEFTVVFVTGCEEGLIPFARPGEAPRDPGEERRLFYVALTRARDLLCLTLAGRRRRFGNITETRKSPFLADMEDLLETLAGPGRKPRKQSPGQVQMDLFQ
jgi:DNA helicase-2/ATP-dependent DNA helicase PcrA